MVRGSTWYFRSPLKAACASVIVVAMGSLTLPLLVFAGQLADGLAYQLAHGRGTELNLAMARLVVDFGPQAILVVKLAAGLALALGAMPLMARHRSLVTWFAVAGFLGAGSELLALL
jgi:hypothetical protein